MLLDFLLMIWPDAIPFRLFRHYTATYEKFEW